MVGLNCDREAETGGLRSAHDRLIAPHLAQRYEENARRHGDDVTAITVEAAAHFEVIAPGSVAWPTVKRAVMSMTGRGEPQSR